MASSSSVRAPNARRLSTRDKILRTSEKLFARDGFDRVTLRQIARASNQGNVAAVQYHFGSKDGLLAEILESHQERIEARRQELLDEIASAGREADRDSMLGILVDPLVEALESASGRAYLCIQAQVLSPDSMRPATRLVVEGIARSLGRAEPGALDGHRQRFAMILLFHGLADRARLEEKHRSSRTERGPFVDALKDSLYGLQRGRTSPT